MTGKKTVFIVIVFTVLVLILAWFLLQYVIKEYDLDPAMGSAEFIVQNISDKYIT